MWEYCLWTTHSCSRPPWLWPWVIWMTTNDIGPLIISAIEQKLEETTMLKYYWNHLQNEHEQRTYHGADLISIFCGKKQKILCCTQLHNSVWVQCLRNCNIVSSELLYTLWRIYKPASHSEMSGAMTLSDMIIYSKKISKVTWKQHQTGYQSHHLLVQELFAGHPLLQ